MLTFEYQAKNGAGESVNGEVVAATQREAIQLLRNQDMLVIRLQEKVRRAVKDSKRLTGGILPWTRRKVNGKELAVFTHQLATLIRSGVPLLECLDILSSEVENQALQQVIRHIREEVENGHMLAQAMSRYPEIFHEFYRSMVEVGETTGRLDESLGQLALYLDKHMQLRAKIFSGLAYPVLLVAVAVFVLTFLMIWVVPLFSGLFQDMGEALPWLTQVVIGTADGMRQNLVWLAGLFGCGLMAVRWMLKDAKCRTWIDGWILRTPGIGPLFRKTATVRFTRTLGFLVHRGVPLLTALGVSGTVTGNKLLAQTITLAAGQVQDGKPLSEALRASQQFPPMVIQMTKVGESTGSLDAMLDKIADLFEQEVDRTVATFASLVEPCVILVVGCGIAVVVVAMYLPIFSIGSVIG